MLKPLALFLIRTQSVQATHHLSAYLDTIEKACRAWQPCQLTQITDMNHGVDNLARNCSDHGCNELSQLC